MALLWLVVIVGPKSAAQDLSANSNGRSATNSSGQGLLSRLRSANTKTKETAPRDSASSLNEDAKDRDQQDRRWSGAMRVPLQSFSLPWSNRNAESKSSIQDPIDLPSAMSAKRNGASTRSAGNSAQRPTNSGDIPTPTSLPAVNPRANGPIGSGVARPRPSDSSPENLPAIETQSNRPEPVVSEPEFNATGIEAAQDISLRKELRVYEAAPSLGGIDSKNTSRRKPSPETTTKKTTVAPVPLEAEPKKQLSLPPLDSPNEKGAEKFPTLIDSAETPTDAPRVPAISTTARNTSRSTERKNAPLDVRVPQLRLRVDGPQSIQVGQKATYTIHATNEGETELQGLIVRASAPKGVKIDGIKTLVGAYEMDDTPEETGVLWELETLSANDSKSLELQIEVLEADQFALNLEWTLAPSPTQMKVQVQQPKLELDLSGPVDVQVGMPQKYMMRIRNSGTADLPELLLLLQTETTSSYESQLGVIPAGSEKLIDVELTFDQPGLFPIVARAQDTSGKLQKLQRIDVQVQKLELQANWRGPDEFIQGTQAEYELVIDNVGGLTATNLDCSITLPEGIEIVELPRGVVRAANQLRWSIQSLQPNNQFILPIRCNMNRSGNQTMKFQVASEQIDGLQATISTLVEAIADLELTVKEPQAPAPVGTPVVYEIQITNHGSKAAENVRVIAQFSEGIEPLKLDGHAGRVVPGQAIFEELSQVAPQQTITLKVVCQASKNGVHRFRAAVQSPTSQEDLLEEGSTRFVGNGIKK